MDKRELKANAVARGLRNVRGEAFQKEAKAVEAANRNFQERSARFEEERGDEDSPLFGEYEQKDMQVIMNAEATSFLVALLKSPQIKQSNAHHSLDSLIVAAGFVAAAEATKAK
jgi:hypothetical protein